MAGTTTSRVSACSCSESARSRSRSRIQRTVPGRGAARGGADACRPSSAAGAGARRSGPAGGAARTSAARGGHRTEAVALQALLQSLGADRRADQVALHLVALQPAQPPQLALGLHALGDDVEAEAVAEIDDRLDDHVVVGAVLEVLDEALV